MRRTNIPLMLANMATQASEVLSETIKETISNPNVYLRIRPQFQNYHTTIEGTKKRLLLVFVVATDHIPLVMGQFYPFRSGDLHGYYTNYYLGVVEAWLKERGLSMSVSICYKGQGKTRSPYEYVKLSEAVYLGLLSQKSKLYKLMKKHELQWVLRAGWEISGPTVAMLETVSSLGLEFKPRFVADLFAGTGAISYLWQKTSAKKIWAVELAEDSPIFKEKNKKVVCPIKANVLGCSWFLPEVDALSIDPFHDQAIEAARWVVREVPLSCKLVIANGGPLDTPSWARSIAIILRKNFKNISVKKYADGFTVVARR